MANAKKENASGDREAIRAEYVIGIVIIIAALMVSLSMYMGASGISQSVNRLAIAAAAAAPVPAQATVQPGGAAAGTPPAGAGAQASGVPPATKEVTIDFLYADWCPHCQKMKPYVAALEQSLPADRFEVRYWSEDDYKAGGQAADVYAAYEAAGYFSGYPTFVINGNDAKAGSMEEAVFKAWVCGKFASPKPAGC